jgi:hypothetical protein
LIANSTTSPCPVISFGQDAICIESIGLQSRPRRTSHRDTLAVRDSLPGETFEATMTILLHGQHMVGAVTSQDQNEHANATHPLLAQVFQVGSGLPCYTQISTHSKTSGAVKSSLLWVSHASRRRSANL